MQKNEANVIVSVEAIRQDSNNEFTTPVTPEKLFVADSNDNLAADSSEDTATVDSSPGGNSVFGTVLTAQSATSAITDHDEVTVLLESSTIIDQGVKKVVSETSKNAVETRQSSTPFSELPSAPKSTKSSVWEKFKPSVQKWAMPVGAMALLLIVVTVAMPYLPALKGLMMSISPLQGAIVVGIALAAVLLYRTGFASKAFVRLKVSFSKAANVSSDMAEPVSSKEIGLENARLVSADETAKKESAGVEVEPNQDQVIRSELSK